MKLRFSCLLVCVWINNAYAFSWQDLWLTPNQQAAKLMQEKQFKAAQNLFQQEDWRGAAAYRAGDYQQAANDYQKINTAEGFYNQGNALAQLGKYKEAITAYDKALALKKDNPDATFNRDIVESLLKQQQQSQEKKSQNSEDKQSENKESENKESENKQSQNSQNKPSENKDAQNKQSQPSENKESENKKSQNEQSQKSQDKQPENKDAQDEQSQSQSAMNNSEQTKEKDQLLQLIPDDPGGLLKEKFLRDYLRKQNGWY